MALVENHELISAEPLPDGLLEAAKLVAADFGLPDRWLNSGPTSLLDFGLPTGCLGRGLRRRYGPGLEAVFVSRLDQVHLKLYATVDQGGGRHLEDLRALSPTEAELLDAAAWSETHDSSAGYRQVLDEVLEYLGVRRQRGEEA